MNITDNPIKNHILALSARRDRSCIISLILSLCLPTPSQIQPSEGSNGPP